MQAFSLDVRSLITGVVLAGGSSSRMQAIAQDKAWLVWQGKPLISHVLERFAPQVGQLGINIHANQDTFLENYQALGLPLWRDQLDQGWEAFPGPMAGMLAGLRMSQTPWLAVVPCDAPLLPGDLVARLYGRAMQTQAKIVIAATENENRQQKDHPVFSLLHTSLQDSLYTYLQGGDRKIMLWIQQHSFERVVFEDARPFTINVNTPEAFHQLGQQPYDELAL